MEAAEVQTIQDLERETTTPRKRKYTSKACSSCRKLKIRCRALARSDGTFSCEHCLKAGDTCLWPEVDARKWSRIRSHRASKSPTHPTGSTKQPAEAVKELVSYDLLEQQTLLHNSDGSEQRAIQSRPSPDLQAGQHLRDTPYTVVQYYRYLGSTAIAPGYKKISLKIAIDGPRVSEVRNTDRALLHLDNVSVIDTHTNLPTFDLLPHLLDAFFEYYGGMFCFLNRQQLESLIRSNEVSSFLLCSLAALSSRFCEPETFAPYFPPLPEGQSREKWEYSLPFLDEAKKLLMPLLSIPSCDLVAGLLFLALAEFGDNNESGMWMFIGMSIRVAQELGLHRQRPAIYTSVSRSPTNDPVTNAVQFPTTNGAQRSQDFDEASQVLLFWVVFVQDTCLANGTGRVPSIQRNEISVRLPTDHDMKVVGGHTESERCVYAFPKMVRMMLEYAKSIEFLNLDSQNDKGIIELQKDVETIHVIRDRILATYDSISEPLRYGANQYRQVSNSEEAIPYLVLHLNFHLQIAFLTQACHAIEFRLPRSSLDKQSKVTSERGRQKSIHNDGSSLVHENHLYRKAIKSIVDILTIARFVDARPLLSTFFLNQSFFHAACAYAGDMLRFQHHSSQQFSATDHNAAFPLPSPLSTSVVFDLDDMQSTAADRANLSSTDTYLALLAKANYQFLRQSITQMARFYAGAAWVDAVLDQRESGIRDVDLSIVSESICTYIRLHELRATHGVTAKNSTQVQSGQSDEPYGGDLMFTDDLLSSVSPDFDSQAFFNNFIFAES